MPDFDPAALKAEQLATAKAQLALDRADASLATAKRMVTQGEALVERAKAGGKAAEIRRAEAARAKALAEAEKLRIDRDRMRKDMNERLKDMLRWRALDAPGDVPLLLLPLRLETRFATDAGKTVLRIRIYPDDIHIDRSGRGLKPDEAEAGQAYWAGLFASRDDSGIGPAWDALRARVGDRRARAVALATRPENAAQRGQAVMPVFPQVAPFSDGGAQPRLLPEQFRVTAWQSGKQFRATGAVIPTDLRVGFLSGDGSDFVRLDDLPVPEGTEWLNDYDRARSLGMAIDLALPARATVSKLFVYGVSQGRSPDQGAAELSALLTAHDGAGLLNFVPRETPTNNTEAGVSGWRRWREVRPVPLQAEAATPAGNAAVTGQALGLDPALLTGAEAAQSRDQAAEAAMQATLWPATWGSFLEALDDRQQMITASRIQDARRFHAGFVRPGGPLPVMAIGSQPYAVLPVIGHPKRAKGPPAETLMASLMTNLQPAWLEAAADLPRIAGRADTENLMEIFGTSPRSWGVMARKVLSHDFLQKAGAVTTDADESREVEVLLNALIAASVGRFSETMPFTSLDTEARPVMLPLADPARDADFLAALLGGSAGGKISSVFQALVSLGWTQLQEEAKPKGDFSGSLALATSISPVLRERVQTLVADASATGPHKRIPLSDYESVLQSLPASPAPAQPVAMPLSYSRDLMTHIGLATSVIEREALATNLAMVSLYAAWNLAAMRNGMEALLAEARTGAPDFTALVAGSLDCASHRLDAWITGLASARLARMRAAKPSGISIGAFGWMFDLAPQSSRNMPEGGYIAAPTMQQATTAGLLRAAWLAHNTGDATGGAFATDLSGARVRRALLLLEGVSNGQPLGALLGYDFERRLSDAGCQRFILCFRGMAPLRAGQLTDSGAADASAVQIAAEANVTDMLVLLELIEKQGEAAILQRLNTPPENAYLEPGQWRGPTTAGAKPETAAIRAAFAAAVTDCDALSDLMTAESVHQLAQGNIARASAVMDAAGKGEAPPPALPDFVTSAGPGVVVTHRLCALARAGASWHPACPRSAITPELEAWATHRLPDPSHVILGPKAGGGKATLADCGLSALDFAALSVQPKFLEQLIRLRAPLANPEAELAGSGPGGVIGLAEAVLIAAALQAVLATATPITAVSIGTRADGWAPAAGAVAAAAARIGAAKAVLDQRTARLRALLSDANVLRGDLMSTLSDLTDFGIIFPDARGAMTADFAEMALAEAEARSKRCTEALKRPADQAMIAAAAEALFGQGICLPLPMVFTPDALVPSTGMRDFTAPDAGAVHRYLADFGTVRPAVGAFQRLALLTRASGRGPVLALRQFCGQGSVFPTGWIGAQMPADQVSPDCPMVSFLADAPDGLLPEDGICGIVIDEWTEVLPERRRQGEGGRVISKITTGVAIHADAPGMEPPQSLLLALSPDGARWTEDALCDLLTEVLDLAKMRLVTFEKLPLYARTLPAIYTQSWSLQGKPVPDWSRLHMDLSSTLATDALRNFTKLKEA